MIIQRTSIVVSSKTKKGVQIKYTEIVMWARGSFQSTFKFEITTHDQTLPYLESDKATHFPSTFILMS